MHLITTKLPYFTSRVYRPFTIFHLALWYLIVATCLTQEFRETNGNIAAISEVSIPQDTVLVDLSYNEITTLRDNDFAHLSQLENLYLIHNQIGTIENGAFNGLSFLQRLFLQNNLITDFPSLSGIDELTELYLQYNEISLLPENVAISSSNKIERLDLSHNKFTSVSNNFLRHFKSLRQLKICCGYLAEVPPVYEIIESLQILEIPNNKIPLIQSQSFTDGSGGSNIKELILENNLCSIEDGLFQNLNELLILNLNGLGLTELPDLTQNNNLRELHVANNSLTILESSQLFGNPPDYTRLFSLIKLNGAHNKMSSFENQTLISLKNLKELNIGSNVIENFPFQSLAQTENLEYLNLESNQIETVEGWGITGRNLKIDLTDNPLDCSTICWLVRSGYFTFDQERLEEVTTELACAKPIGLVSLTWGNITNNPDLVCAIQGTSTTTEVAIVSDGRTDGPNTKSEDGSSNSLSIVVGIAVAVFVVAAIVAIVSVVIYRVCGKKDQDVILIRKMESNKGIGEHRRRSEKKGNGVNLKDQNIRREKGHRPASKQSPYSKSPRNSRLQTISEKSEDIDNGSKNVSEVNRKDNEKGHDSGRRSTNHKGRDNPMQEDSMKKSETFDRDPTMSQELPFEYTYRV